MRNTTLTAAVARRVQDVHVELASLIEMRDAAGARRLMDDHVQDDPCPPRGGARHAAASDAGLLLKPDFAECSARNAKKRKRPCRRRHPRISYVYPKDITDKAMLDELDRCAKEGTPRPESQAVRAHVPAVFWSFANTWRDVFHTGVAEHAIKELCRIYVSHSVKCEFCGNQRSIKARTKGVVEEDYKDLLNFEKSTRYDERQKAALAYAEAITWDLDTDDAFWARLKKHFTEAGAGRDRLLRRRSRWASSAGCARSTSSTTRSSPAPMARWRRASRPGRRCRNRSPIPSYWARKRQEGEAGSGGVNVRRVGQRSAARRHAARR